MVKLSELSTAEAIHERDLADPDYGPSMRGLGWLRRSRSACCGIAPSTS